VGVQKNCTPYRSRFRNRVSRQAAHAIVFEEPSPSFARSTSLRIGLRLPPLVIRLTLSLDRNYVVLFKMDFQVVYGPEEC
jgi:hypothetical protein